MKRSFTEMAGITHPLIMAPMFLVTNAAMLEAGMKAGVLAAFPTLNYRNEGELEAVLQRLNAFKAAHAGGSYAVNLITQQSNPLYKKHLAICAAAKVPVYITSLGSPKEVIETANSYGALVLCDVTNLTHARKAAALGCHGFIAVGQGAGGHAGPHPLQILVPALKKEFPDKLVIAAGGIADGRGMLSVEVLGADAVSVGTRFIASTEAGVNDAYKQAVVNAGMDDIVMTTKLSGTPCTIIDTPEAKRMGYEQNWFERFMSNNPRTKKWFKTIVHVRGMKRLEQSVLPNNYKRLWCAGKSAELIGEIIPCEEIVERMMREYAEARKALCGGN
ncbi:MAG: nitronate monooxygenase [Bacteroidetes bacterium]|nr:nitronate monooxygenase [Bacteroidota bacterium]